MDFLQQQIAVLETQITAAQAAITALVSGGVQSYQFNTGQTSETVTRLDLDRLNALVDSLMSRYLALKARYEGGSVTIAAPAW